MSREREKEEKIFQAIGDLPEDMVADAVNYRLTERKPRYIEKWILAGKGFACAACAALVIFWAVPWAYNNYGGGNQTKTEEFSAEKQESESGSISNEKTYDYALDEMKTEEVYLCSEADNMQESMKIGKEVDRKETKSAKDSQEKAVTGEVKKLTDGKTVRLNVKSVPYEESSEGNITILPLRIGKKDDGVTYTIHSEALNCTVFSVTGSEQERKGEAGDAECMGGDRIELNTFERSEPGWAKSPVPEWDKKKINIIDIIDFTGEKEGEKYDFGRIVIGKKGGNYYGMYQKRKG
ncbi:hypothetical protein D7V86_19000 [bacterium D16-51]|nr:hypothetical protein D7V96_06385 [bacterium D16-59]RKI56678.1 hypothetical protein D7V86_19000 [bacterium D16-51]